MTTPPDMHASDPASAAPEGGLPLRAVTLFTGSAAGHDPVFAEEVDRLAAHLSGERIGLVYGGGKVGLMGVIGDAARKHGADVTGVIPQALVSGEIAHEGLTSLEIVADMHERKQRMGELGDAFVALPGGAGTLEEFFEMWTWQQLGIHRCPVALYDVGGFWEPMLTMLDEMVRHGFIKPTFRDGLIVARDPRTLVAKLRAWTPPRPKWQKEPVDTRG